jgi:predicted RNA-binding Zn ribbon-like protein
MPEHSRGTPGRYYALESFVWRDFRTPAEWTAWTETHGLAGSAAHGPAAHGSAFDLATRLQHALRTLAAWNNGEIDGQIRADSAIATIDRLIVELRVRPSLDPLGGLHLRADAEPRYAAVVAVLVMALDAMATGEWRRFKLCRDPECRASYYDSSRNATRIWCSMKLCGSRNKMRRHRERAAE